MAVTRLEAGTPARSAPSAMAEASAEEAEAAERAEVPASGQVAATAFPVPPLDLPHYHGVAIDNQTSTREVAGA